MYFRIAKGKIDLSKLRDIDESNGILQKKITKTKNKKIESDETPIINTKEDTLIIGDDFNGFDYKIAQCCNPIPGDKVFGFISISDGIKVHRYNCPNAENMMSKMAYRCLKAQWKSEKLIEREAAIKIMGIDQIGLVNKLTEIISKENNVNMKSIAFDTEDGIFEGKIKVMVYDTEHLELLMQKFEQVEGVQNVSRWDNQEKKE